MSLLGTRGESPEQCYSSSSGPAERAQNSVVSLSSGPAERAQNSVEHSLPDPRRAQNSIELLSPGPAERLMTLSSLSSRLGPASVGDTLSVKQRSIACRCYSPFSLFPLPAGMCTFFPFLHFLLKQHSRDGVSGHRSDARSGMLGSSRLILSARHFSEETEVR